MKIGDLVYCNHPNSWAKAASQGGGFPKGIIVSRREMPGRKNKMFDVVWFSGKKSEKVWDYDLKPICDV